MIGFLAGTLKIVDDDVLIIINDGVGYLVNVGPTLLNKLANQQTTELYIHTHVKEDQLALFGFKTYKEKKLFQLLLNVSGVGPTTALNIADLGAERITQAVQEAQVTAFTAIPRVGKKLAQKIIIELKPKLGSLKELELGEVSGQTKELAEALLALGFDEQTAYQTARKFKDDQRPIEVVLKEAIQGIKN